MTRYTTNWLKAYQEYTAESEAPETYHLWTGLSVIASALRRNVWLNQGLYMLYPNLFVVLVAPPGKVGKSTVLRMGKILLKQLEEVEFGPDSTTREDLIRRLAKSYSGGQSALTIHSSELSSLIDPSGIAMIQVLTDLYDCEYTPPAIRQDASWQYSTKTQGQDKVINPVLNILAATTPSWIAEGFPEKAISHGFTARTIFVYEETTRFANPFPDEADSALVKALVHDLQHISKLEGEFSWHPEAKERYEEIYGEIRESQPKDHRIEGYHWRKRTHILKLAMLLTIAEQDGLVIEPRAIETAQNILHITEENMAKTFSAVGKYEFASDAERILSYITEKQGVTFSDIVQRNISVGDARELSNIVNTLAASGAVEYGSKEDGQTIVRPTERAIEQLRRSSGPPREIGLLESHQTPDGVLDPEVSQDLSEEDLD